MKKLIALAAASLALFFTGCYTTLDDAVQDRGTGRVVTYQATFDEVWASLPQLIDSVGLKFVSANRKDQLFLAQRGEKGYSFGENVAIFVKIAAPGKLSIEVVSKKVVTTNIFGVRDWSKDIFAGLDKKFKRA